jgi:steroid 5-alpha reductase family enzyme
MLLELILPAAACTSALFLALWVVQAVRRDATAVDVGWAFSLGALAVAYALASDAPAGRRLLVAGVGGIWGLRLALHLFRDRVLGHDEEDGRYRELRAGWGSRANSRFFLFYQAQALLALVLSAPFLLAAGNPAPFPHPLEIAGAALWGIGLAGETVADRQLARFRANPAHRGKTCRVGLWKTSRHPNYFFEWLIWCSFALIALPAPLGWIGIASPVLMLVFILAITGIPPAERRALESRGEDYRRYQRTTSPFVPWFPGKEASG